MAKTVVVAWLGLHVIVLLALPAGAVTIHRATKATVSAPVANPPNPPGGNGGDNPQMGFFPDGGYGEAPASHYVITYSGGGLTAFDRKFLGSLTTWMWDLDTMMVSAGLWLIGFAFHNGIAGALKGPFMSVGRALQIQVLGPLRLGETAWFVLMVVAGWHALRGRVAAAAGEVALSCVCVAVFGIIAAHPVNYMNGSLRTSGALSGAVLQSAGGESAATTQTGSGTAGTAAAVLPAQRALFKAFIDEPYQVVEFGHVLTRPACVAQLRKALASTQGRNEVTKNGMADAGCKAEADWENTPSGQRFGAAFFSMAVGGAVMVLLGLIAFTLILATVGLVATFAAVPVVAPFAVLPGSGRVVLWRWVAALVKALLAVVGMSVLMVVLVSATKGFLDATDHTDPTVRFMLVLVAVVMMFLARKRILHSVGHAAERLGDHLAAQRPGRMGGSAGWLAPAAIGGVTGLAMGVGGREVAAAGRQVRSGVSQVAAKPVQWRARRRQKEAFDKIRGKGDDNTGTKPDTTDADANVGASEAGARAAEALSGWRTLRASGPTEGFRPRATPGDSRGADGAETSRSRRHIRPLPESARSQELRARLGRYRLGEMQTSGGPLYVAHSNGLSDPAAPGQGPSPRSTSGAGAGPDRSASRPPAVNGDKAADAKRPAGRADAQGAAAPPEERARKRQRGGLVLDPKQPRGDSNPR